MSTHSNMNSKAESIRITQPSILHRLDAWANESPTAIALRFKKKGEWATVTTRSYRDQVHYLACYFESLGMKRDQIGAILSYNNPQWVIMEMALMLAGPKSAGLYPNSTTKDIHYVLNHTEAKVLGVQNKDYFKKVIADGMQLPDSIHTIIAFDDDVSIHPSAVAYSKALEIGQELARQKPYQSFLDHVKVTENAFLIYTSGTTGNPKAAMLSHDNLIFASDEISKRWSLPDEGQLFSFLPLCHIAEKFHSMGVGISKRYTVSYCSKFENVSAELVDVEPTLLLCVPRVWEKMMEGVMNKIAKGTGIKKHLAEWSFALGERIAKAKTLNQTPALTDLLGLPIAEKLVLSKVRKALGLRRAKLLASGAAPLPAHVAKWFKIFGLSIYECYGLTETAGIVSVTVPAIDCTGTVGKPFESTEFKIEADGEICSKGRHIFLGYYKNPEATAESIKEGWFHTGDLGKWNEQGLLQIVGRKREIMKSSGGKMVSPVQIEERIKESNIISQVCMVGDNRKYFSALVTLSETTINDLKNKSGALKDGKVVDETVYKEVKAQFDSVNSTLASFEQIKNFTIIDREFSIADSEMTPTMKMKRAVIEKNFKAIIDSMYS